MSRDLAPPCSTAASLSCKSISETPFPCTLVFSQSQMCHWRKQHISMTQKLSFEKVTPLKKTESFIRSSTYTYLYIISKALFFVQNKPLYLTVPCQFVIVQFQQKRPIDNKIMTGLCQDTLDAFIWIEKNTTQNEYSTHSTFKSKKGKYEEVALLASTEFFRKFLN